jgi:hypothetical protein
VKLAALVSLVMLADLATFAAVVPLSGIGPERNPIIVRGYIEFGLLAVVAFKLAGTSVILAAMALQKRLSARRLLAVVGVAFGLFGALGNVVAGVQLS